jgi:hypothetical protein
MNNAQNVNTTRGKIQFSRLFSNSYQKAGSKTLEVKQIINTISSYASKKYNSNLQDGLFSETDFGGETTEFTSTETRVAWILVPEGKGETEIRTMLNTLPSACIYKVLSNEPILDDNQKQAIANGLKAKADFANAQAVRYGDTHENAGQLILDADGNVQYRRTFFSKEVREDEDYRGNGQVYMSREIEMEIDGAIAYHTDQVL